MSFRPLRSLAAALTLGAVALAAQADSSSASQVVNHTVSPPIVNDAGTTSSGAVIQGASASSKVDPSTGFVGGIVAASDPLGGAGATTSVTHSDVWSCSGGATCRNIAQGASFSIPVDFHFMIDGTESGGGYWQLDATYTTSFGTSFEFFVYQDGPSTTGGFVDINGTRTPVQVQGSYGSSSFSFDAGAVLSIPAGSSATFDDTQTLSLLLEPEYGETDQLDAAHTFAVTLVSQDPQAVLSSADGRSALPVPETPAAALLAIGLAVIGLNAKRRRT